ncbi:MAG: phosphate acyltransferase [candidate division KSB1 bacterium]|nr:phosphate acyltransferase [candidate division KSB1 bacterium]MDZ7276302.1 phosphate acyltransferase [candidate division KSB1 bacterium]MDZ7287745.1 phosphate acyltransferase [candidate division KSB1 bacterium]MDZ7299915.1 phosphate acyltransferase [candidate division KSB1 bacterium]MDZ7308375.1 phosphate acyltransferase [candidate division KSB1 bacterium]
MIENFAALRRLAQQRGPKRVAVVMADDAVALAALAQAVAMNLATPVLIGEVARIRAQLAILDAGAALDNAILIAAPNATAAAATAVNLCRNGEVDLLLKGHLRTDELMHAVLDKQQGLHTGRLLSDVLLYEDTLTGVCRLVGVTDGGINVLPTLEQKKQILANGVAVMHALGCARPRVALLSATEAVTRAVPSTVEARALTEWTAAGEAGECEVFGPLALDNALLESAAFAKGITSPVAGHADLMVVPNLEAGNILGKAVKYFGKSPCGHVIVGARVPVLIPSRVESAEDKLNAVALGVVLHASQLAENS